MSGLVMGLVWEQPITSTFRRPEKYILLAYADHADQNGKNIYPSVELISEKTGYEERSIQSMTRSLETMGYLVPDGMGPHGTNRYLIPVERIPGGGAKIAPLNVKNLQPSMQNFAPEGIAPEGIAPEPIVVVKRLTEREKKNPTPDFSKMTIPEARKWPTIRLYTDATDFFPGSILWEYVDTFITEHTLTADKIKAAAVEWMARGYKQNNVKGILEWAAFGIPPAGKNNQSGEPVRKQSVIFKSEEHPEPGYQKMPDSVREKLGKLRKKMEVDQ